jgi:hypothetical protein
MSTVGVGSCLLASIDLFYAFRQIPHIRYGVDHDGVWAGMGK